MRNRRKTIESLRRLAERPGTPSEGETARRFLEQMGGKPKVSFPGYPFIATNFPKGTAIYYCYWCYPNDHGTICSKPPKMIQGEWWMLIKFDRLKQARWVPVTSKKGCHIRSEPFIGEEARWMELIGNYILNSLDLEEHDARMEEMKYGECVHKTAPVISRGQRAVAG